MNVAQERFTDHESFGPRRAAQSVSDVVQPWHRRRNVIEPRAVEFVAARPRTGGPQRSRGSQRQLPPTGHQPPPPPNHRRGEGARPPPYAGLPGGQPPPAQNSAP